MGKSPDAFRTISEVADWLGIQAHVLRFWESKFTQVRPVKRAGGRRYYRPGDMLLLGGIKQLLHEDGLTIKGVQKILREEGMSHVSALSQPLDELTQSQMQDVPEATLIEAPEEPAEETGVVLSFETPAQKTDAAPAPEASKAPTAIEPETAPGTPPPAQAEPEDAPLLPAKTQTQEPSTPETETATEAKGETALSEAENPAPLAETPAEPETEAPKVAATAPATDTPQVSEPVAPAETATPMPGASDADAERAPERPEPAEPRTTDADGDALPAFLRRPMPDQPAPQDNPPPVAETSGERTQAEPAEPAPPPAPMPRVIETPPLTPHEEIPAAPALLTAVHRTRRLTNDQAARIAPLLEQLTILRDSMAARRRGTGPTP